MSSPPYSLKDGRVMNSNKEAWLEGGSCVLPVPSLPGRIVCFKEQLLFVEHLLCHWSEIVI